MDNQSNPKSNIPIHFALGFLCIWLAFSTVIGYIIMSAGIGLGGRQITFITQLLFCLAPLFVFLSMLVLTWYFTEKTAIRGIMLFFSITLGSLLMQALCYSIGFQLIILSYQNTYLNDDSNTYTDLDVAYRTATAVALALNPPATATQNSEIVALEEALRMANNPLTNNAEWQAAYPNGFIWEFDGVPMVLVPAGCFRMGNDTGAYSEEGDLDGTGVHDGGEQCFEEAFWIDQTEVTQKQFEDFGYELELISPYRGDNFPVHLVSWYAGRDYCVHYRDGKVPSEAEWEYAARGPESWIYPWGNHFERDNAVWNRDFFDGPLDIGLFPVGRSWVGALDMVGNVAEWTRSQYASYPYNPNDGREDEDVDEDDYTLVFSIRGSFWGTSEPSQLRAASRFYRRMIDWQQYYNGIYLSLRCVRYLN